MLNGVIYTHIFENKFKFAIMWTHFRTFKRLLVVHIFGIYLFFQKIYFRCLRFFFCISKTFFYVVNYLFWDSFKQNYWRVLCKNSKGKLWESSSSSYRKYFKSSDCYTFWSYSNKYCSNKIGNIGAFRSGVQIWQSKSSIFFISETQDYFKKTPYALSWDNFILFSFVFLNLRKF